MAEYVGETVSGYWLDEWDTPLSKAEPERAPLSLFQGYYRALLLGSTAIRRCASSWKVA